MYDIVETVELLLLLLAETKDHASDVTVFATPLLWLDVARGAYVGALKTRDWKTRE